MEDIKQLYKLKMIYAVLKESTNYMAAFLDEIDEYDCIESALTEENIRDTLNLIDVNLNTLRQYMPNKNVYKELFIKN